ncbi:hypothetical protein L1049_014624 [Liquidambar formosana]|uniref:TF-B3 domain-containing protein n=1 Tax=Liquidambar formosana TaxID=63359 RepID=A0AAP0X5J5_LIQFO
MKDNERCCRSNGRWRCEKRKLSGVSYCEEHALGKKGGRKRWRTENGDLTAEGGRGSGGSGREDEAKEGRENGEKGRGSGDLSVEKRGPKTRKKVTFEENRDFAAEEGRENGASGSSRKKFGACRSCGHNGTTPVKVEENAIEVERYIHPKNPYFVTKKRPRRMNELYVPVDVLQYPNLNLPPKVTFYDSNGREWPGKVTSWGDGRAWIVGWKAFCKWNNVGKNDSCICEFLEERGHWGSLIQVHIVRAGPQTANT